MPRKLVGDAAATDHTRVVFLSLVLAGMAFALSQTVVSPALPEIQRQYGADPASAAWILTGYLLAASVGDADRRQARRPVRRAAAS